MKVMLESQQQNLQYTKLSPHTMRVSIKERAVDFLLLGADNEHKGWSGIPGSMRWQLAW